MKGFFDPSVEFGLQFEQIGAAAADAGAKPEAVPAPKKSGGETANAPAVQMKPRRTTPAVPAVPTPANPETAPPTISPRRRPKSRPTNRRAAARSCGSIAFARSRPARNLASLATGREPEEAIPRAVVTE